VPLPAAADLGSAYGQAVIGDAELAAAIARRSHWQLDEQGVVYARPGASGHVRIRPVRAPARTRERYLASVKNEAALQSTTMATAVSALAWSERRKLDT